jgi:transposase InsO family protein
MSRRRDHRELLAVNAELRADLRRLQRELERLRVANEVLHEAAEPLIHGVPAHERFAFIHRLRARVTAKRLCRILVTDRSNYYLWTMAEARRGARAREEQELLKLVVEIHTAHPAYGSERITRELQRQGFEVGRRRVARLMREHGIAGITLRKRRKPTKPDKDPAAVPDPILREFTAPMPGLKLVGDISCFPTTEGWLYLATALDLCSKELIGYAIAPHMRASLAIEAITAARRAGLVGGSAIMHTDRGSNTTREATGTRCGAWRFGRVPAVPDHASPAPRPNRSPPPSRRRTAQSPGSTAPAPAVTSRTGSRPVTSGGFTRLSTIGLRPRPVVPGRSA